MNVAESLRASADAFLRQGHETSYVFARSLADQAERMGPTGEAIYSNWSEQLAERAARVTPISYRSK